MANCFRLIVLSACFFVGWGITQTCEQFGNAICWPAWEWGACIFAFMTLVHGSWPVLPRMLLGFLPGQAIYWTLFYLGDWYYPDKDDVFGSFCFGCCSATLAGAASLMLQKTSPATGGIRSPIIPAVSFYIAMILTGGFAFALSSFGIDRLGSYPEAAALVMALLSLLAISFAFVLTRPR